MTSSTSDLTVMLSYGRPDHLGNPYATLLADALAEASENTIDSGPCPP